MSASANPVANHGDHDQLQAVFVHLLARIETQARMVFRDLKCPHRRADAVQETIALCWKWFLRATQQGKNVTSFVSVLAAYAIRAVRSGRRLCGQEKSRDALSSLAQQRRHFTIQSLPTYETGVEDNATLDALRDNTKTPPDEQAAFRIDFAVWLEQLGERNRQLAQDMALGHRTLDLAEKYHTSQGRISQLRREFHNDWLAFL
jgi:DNA-directed RNA polymerase specialized sigma24 family protein